MSDDQNVPTKWVEIFAMHKDEAASAEVAEAEVERLRAELAQARAEGEHRR